MEDKYPCPPPKPLVFLKKDDKLPPIAVTVPKMGFRPDSGCIASKYHPLFFPKLGVLNMCKQPHASCSIVDPRLSEKEAAGTAKPPQVAGNTALQSCCEEVVLGPGCCTHPAQSATSPITESELHPFSQTTNICFDVINMTSLEIFAAVSQGQSGSERNIPVIQEATSPSPSQKESG